MNILFRIIMASIVSASLSSCASKTQKDESEHKESLNCLSTNGAVTRTVYGGCPNGTVRVAEVSNPRMSPMNGNSDNEKEQLYNSAFHLLMDADYDGSRNLFKLFMEKYPKDSKTSDASYWLGMISWTKGEWEDAIPFFIRVYQDYPNSQKAPESLLRLGQSQANLGKKLAACAALAKISSEYPNTSEKTKSAAQAQETNLGC